MQFSILIYETKENFEARTHRDHQQAYWSGTMAYLAALKEAGVFVGGAGLELPDKALTLSYDPSGGKPKIQDGPVTEIKEQLGGFFIVNCASIEEATQWAARFPQRPGLKVEVRPNLAQDR